MREVKPENSLMVKCPKVAKEWNYNKNGVITPWDVSAGYGKKVWWKCEKSHEWTARIQDRVRGNGCPYCSGRLSVVGENDLSTTYPELTLEWNYEKNCIIQPSDVKPGSSRKVWWKCIKGHEWQAIVVNRVRGAGCPICANKKVLKGYNDLATINPYLALEWDYEKNTNITPQELTTNSHKKVWWHCSNCNHRWMTSPHARTNGKTGCPKCSKEVQTSFPEQAIYFYLKKYFPDTINSDINAIGMELDIYIPSEKIAVEYDGAKWHKGSNRIERRKNKLCNDKDILLIRIRESGLEEYDDCALCIIRKNRHSVTDLTETIVKLLTSISKDLITDIDVERDSKLIYAQYVTKEKSRSLQELYPLVAKEWHPELNGSLTPDKVRAKSRQKVWWQCSLGHEWKATVGDRTMGTGCPYCSGRKILPGYNDLTITSPILSKEWNYVRTLLG